MDRNEFIRAITILKTQPNSNKGFSFRRTIKTLKWAKENKPLYEFQKELMNAKGVDTNGESGY